ncbi:MAG: FKBP-type peptidyl-prolyl cis-trans isomerase [Candidatus Dojkabacteria bacterium]
MKISKSTLIGLVSVIAVIAVVVGIFLFLDKGMSFTDKMGRTQENSTGGKEVEDSSMKDFESLEIETLKEGSGAEAVDGNTVVVHYEGTLRDGTKFDSSFDRDVPFEFILGNGEVIQGWEQGIKGMKVGEERELHIPSKLAYGQDDLGTIPAGSGLIFKVVLLEIK